LDLSELLSSISDNELAVGLLANPWLVLEVQQYELEKKIKGLTKDNYMPNNKTLDGMKICCWIYETSMKVCKFDLTTGIKNK